jgi:tetratricopeptide (TPR) repeat protein
MTISVEVRQSTEAEQLKRAFCQVMAAAANQISQYPTLSESEQLKLTIPHIQEATTTLETWLTDEDVIFLASGLARFYAGQAAHIEAIRWQDCCLALAKTRLGDNHFYVATSLSTLAMLYRMQGNYHEAEPLYRQALEIAQQQLLIPTPNFASGIAKLTTIASILNNLALLFHKQGRYSEAESFYHQALEISQQLLGESDPLVATSLHNLAECYYLQGRYTEAEPLCLKSLHIRQQQLGESHPLVAQSLSNLAQLYTLQNRYGEAEPLCLRSLEIRQQQLGENHPDAAVSLYKLADLYIVQKRYSEAEPMCLQSLEINKQQLGEAHIQTAYSLGTLAKLYAGQERYKEAEPLYLQTLAILERSLGQSHPTTRAMNDCFLLMLVQVIGAGKIEDLSNHSMTQALLPRSLEMLEQTLGTKHPTLTIYLNNLAHFYHKQGRSAEAEALYLKTLAILRNYWENPTENLDPDKANILNKLADLYYAQERYSEAEPLCREALSILRQQLGDSHPVVAKKFNDLAYLVHKQNRHSEAEPLYRQSLKTYLKQQEDTHIDGMLVIFDNLARLLREQSRYAEEEQLYLQTLTAMKGRFSTHSYFQTIDAMFTLFLRNLLQTGQSVQLSDDPMTQDRLQQLLNLLQQQLGEKHLAFAKILNNMAEFYRSKKRYRQAEPLYIRALTIVENQLGQGHLDFQVVWQNLLLFLSEVIRENKVDDLSAHPVMQMLIEKIFLKR